MDIAIKEIVKVITVAVENAYQITLNNSNELINQLQPIRDFHHNGRGNIAFSCYLLARHSDFLKIKPNKMSIKDYSSEIGIKLLPFIINELVKDNSIIEKVTMDNLFYNFYLTSAHLGLVISLILDNSYLEDDRYPHQNFDLIGWASANGNSAKELIYIMAILELIQRKPKSHKKS